MAASGGWVNPVYGLWTVAMASVELTAGSASYRREGGGSAWESNPPLRGLARSRTALKAAQVTRPESLPWPDQEMTTACGEEQMVLRMGATATLPAGL